MKTLKKLTGHLLLMPYYWLVAIQALLGLLYSTFMLLADFAEWGLDRIDTTRIYIRREIRLNCKAFFPIKMPPCIRKLNPKR